MIRIRLCKSALFLIFLSTISFGNAQLIGTVVGSASELGNNCFQVTPPLQTQSGGIWYSSPIDLNKDFIISYQSNFGNLDSNGADGIAWVIKSDPRAVIGASGEGIGYGGIRQSLAVEFDTYRNGSNLDPGADHVAITRDGFTNHSAITNLAGPVNASATSSNIEDGLNHIINIEWIASTGTLNIYFDCILRLSYTDDIITNIFLGDHVVYFGFVASTGALFNSNVVCFNSISFVENLILNDTTICNGEVVNVDATTPNGITYSWSPLEGVSDPSIPNPTITPTTTTTYSVTITDTCGDTSTENITITVTSDSAPEFNQVGPICIGDTLDELPTTDLNGISGTWSPPINNVMTTTYSFTPNNASCTDPFSMTIDVNPLPIVDLGNDQIVYCVNENESFTEIIDTALSTSLYNFEWFLNDILLSGENNSSLSINQEGVYKVMVTNKTTNCTQSDSLEVIIKINTANIRINKLSEDFSENNSIEVLINDTGKFEYQLDNGTWQDQNIFTNIEGCGIHHVNVRGGNLCNELTASFFIFDYPKFFTPNNDGINDSWNIDCVSDQPEALLIIFDRYGKLVSKFSPAAGFWDGTYQGKPLPSTDYWFVLNYKNNTNDKIEQFKNHFTLKR